MAKLSAPRLVFSTSCHCFVLFFVSCFAVTPSQLAHQSTDKENLTHSPAQHCTEAYNWDKAQPLLVMAEAGMSSCAIPATGALHWITGLAQWPVSSTCQVSLANLWSNYSGDGVGATCRWVHHDQRQRDTKVELKVCQSKGPTACAVGRALVVTTLPIHPVPKQDWNVVSSGMLPCHDQPKGAC